MRKKLKIIFMILAYLCLFRTSFSQDISLTVNNLPVKEAITLLKEKTGYSFLFEVGDIDTKKKITFTVKNSNIDEIVQKILEGQDVSYLIIDKNIVLTRKTPKKASNKITGTILDKLNDPIIGATVYDTVLKKGTVTDYKGNFSIDADVNSVLQISYIGYLTQNINVKGRTNVKVILEDNIQALEGIVVIGYGSVRKTDVTGSVASIKPSELNQSSSTLEQGLIGHTPGVEVKQVSGAPGSETTIRVRGVNSVYAGVEPLYVIDGYPASKDVYLNSDDIESIEILKDAASAAIYGSRASGGVVLITTKRGSGSGAKIQIDYQSTMQELSHKIDMMNADEQRELHKDGYNNAYFDYLRMNNIYSSVEDAWEHSRSDDSTTRIANGASSSMILCPDLLATDYNTDWQDAVFSKAKMDRVNFNVTGGKEDLRYMFSVGYLDQNGIVSPSNHKRITSRGNFDIDVNSRFKIGINTSLYYVKERVVRTDGLAFNDGVILNTLGMLPQYPVYEDDGSYATGWSYKNGATSYNCFGGENPVALANLIQRYYTRTRYNLNTKMEYLIANGLKAKVNGGMQVSNRIYRYYRPAEEIGQSNYEPGDYDNLARSSNDRDFNTDWLLETMLEYKNSFNSTHHLNGILGYSMQEKEYDNIDADGEGYTSDRISELSGAGATDTDDNGTSAVTDRFAWSLMSFFGRLMYNYDDKYTLSGTLRSDGCSRFGSDNRWGIFPSISAGWIVSDEAFLSSQEKLSLLKLRASWGISGNNNIGNYLYIPEMESGTYNFGSSTVTTYYPDGFTDLDLGWEKTSQYNFGIDLGFFQNRVNMISNFYYSKTNDLLYEKNVSAITGSTSYWTNLEDGYVYNKGFDLQVNGAIISKEDFHWNLGFNVSVNRNKVDGLTEEITVKGQRKQITHITRNGNPIGSFYGLVSEGLITADDYELIKEDAEHEDEDGYELQGPPVENYDEIYIGDVKWKDVDGDGSISEDDRDIIGNNYPDFSYGISTSISWKNISLSATFNGQYGADVINFSRYYIGNMEGGVNSMSFGLNRYRSEESPGDGSTYRANRVAKNLNTKFSTYYVEDASYFRCTNLTLGYTIPQILTSKIGINNLYLYASTDNLFTITDYTGYNPDVDYNSDILAPGIDFGTYPLSRNYSIGIKVTL